MRLAGMSNRFPWVRQLMFLNVDKASFFVREWEDLILLSSVHWLWIVRLVRNRSSNSSGFADLQLEMGLVVVSDFVNLVSWLMLLLNFQELLLLANCWRPNKSWSAWIVEGMFNCAIVTDLWGVHSIVFLKKLRGAKRDFFLNSCNNVRCLCREWIKEALTSEWGSFWERSSFVLCVASFKVLDHH